MNKQIDWIKRYPGRALFMIVLRMLAWLVLLFTMLGVTACGGCVFPRDAPTSSVPIIITNGPILDGSGAEPVRDGIVAIVGARIALVGSAADYSFPSDAQVIDACGGTILPGIIDAHVHGVSTLAMRRLFLVSGVTSVCDVGLSLGDMPEFDEATLGHDLVARGFRAGPILTAPGTLPGAVLGRDLNYEVKTPHEARAAVIDLHEHGADAIKVYLQWEDGGVQYPMISKEQLAQARGLLVRAHVSYASLLNMAIRLTI